MKLVLALLVSAAALVPQTPVVSKSFRSTKPLTTTNALVEEGSFVPDMERRSCPSVERLKWDEMFALPPSPPVGQGSRALGWDCRDGRTHGGLDHPQFFWAGTAS